jgi:hypothetical protein
MNQLASRLRTVARRLALIVPTLVLGLPILFGIFSGGRSGGG